MTPHTAKRTTRKRELLDRLVARLCQGRGPYLPIDLTAKGIQPVVDGFMAEIIQALVLNERLELRDFFTFEPVTRAPRRGYSYQTRSVITIPERRSVRVKMSMLLLNKLGRRTRKAGVR